MRAKQKCVTTVPRISRATEQHLGVVWRSVSAARFSSQRGKDLTIDVLSMDMENFFFYENGSFLPLLGSLLMSS
jgi:hypothetical protein